MWPTIRRNIYRKWWNGGGSQNDLPWRNKDEDDQQWVRRLGKKPRTELKR